VIDLLRKVTLIVIAIALFAAQSAAAKPGNGSGDATPTGNAFGLYGFSDGR
jgi:hypothetical protein